MKIKSVFFFMIVIGAVGIMVSAFPVSYGTSLGGPLESHSVKGRIYGYGGDIHYALEVDNDCVVSLFFLSLADTLEYIRTHDLSNITPIYTVENVTSKDDIVPIVFPGLYSVIASNPSNNTINFELIIDRIYPQRGILVPGVIIAVIGMVGLLGQKLQKRF